VPGHFGLWFLYHELGPILFIMELVIIIGGGGQIFQGMPNRFKHRDFRVAFPARFLLGSELK
jgi:hypothetical protein